jgi:3-oxoacyl-[acyl-carrier protein] reductase
MDLEIAGRTALVFGGSKGLGRGVAEALAAEGVHLALIARGRPALDEAARAMAERFGVPVHSFSADLGNHDAVLAAVKDAERALGDRIDILINNTGGPPPSGVAGVDPAVWAAQFHQMVLSVIRSTDAVLPGMRRRGWGRILTVASTTVVEPNPALGLSNTLRSALAGWSKTLSAEVGSDGITVNLLLPGRIETDRTRFLDETAAAGRGVATAEIKATHTANIAAGRYGTPEEFGAVAAFLASERASDVTGSMIRVDGGALRSI